MNKIFRVFIILLFTVLTVVTPAYANNKNGSNNTVTVGETQNADDKPKKVDTPVPENKNPYIKSHIITGKPNKGVKGVDYFKNITISLIGENLNDDHFLTKEGLHWGDKTFVESIKGDALGVINDASTFQSQNTPSVPVKAYPISNGSSGRINFVGTTKSGIELDLIWTVTGSDTVEWKKYSGFNSNGKVKGLAFAGEQTIPGASGNSIVVLYNQASNLALNYRIVKHGMQIEMPVILSFISTDIDAAQGVETNLANITQIVPDDSALKIKDNIIYDNTPGVVGYNGSKDLPRGGYLGAGFLSNFDYVFYSPAPERVNNSYAYPIAVRYDIFGSSLQANILTQISQHIQVQYVDTKGVELKPSEHYEGFTNKKYDIDAINIENYQLINAESDLSNPLRPVIKFIYTPEYVYKLHFVDNSGKQLLDSKTYAVLDGDTVEYTPENIDGYKTPDSYKTVVNNNGEYKFVYVKNKIKQTNHIPNKTSGNNSKKTGVKIVSPTRRKSGGGYTIHNRLPQKPKVEQSKPQVKKHHNPTKKQQTDIFCKNTGICGNNKKLFLQYINEIAKNPEKGYTVNHAVANALAYKTYHDDFLESKVNDFGKKPYKDKSEIEKLLYNIHNHKIFFD